MRTEPAPVRRRPCTAAVTTARTKENTQKMGQRWCQLAVRSHKQGRSLLVEATVAVLGASKRACCRVRKPITHVYREIRGSDGEKEPVTRSGGVSWVMQGCD